MSDTERDRDLSARFARMREDDLRAGAPDLLRMLERARPSDVGAVMHVRRLVRLAGWAALASAAAVAGVLMTDRTTSDVEFDRLVTSYATGAAPRIWDSPTVGLLAVPGVEFLRAVPTVGPSALPTVPLDRTEAGS